MLWDLPPKPFIVGMNHITQQLIDDFFALKSKRRICSLNGFAGIGKSALARHAINYVQERILIKGGCIYVNMRSVHRSMETVYVKLMKAIRSDASGYFNMANEQEKDDV